MPETSPSGHPAAVVLIHGIFMRPPVMYALAGRLERAGYRPHHFSYATTTVSCAENARRLHRFAAGVDAGTVHFVAHSLGGLVLRHAFPLLADSGPVRSGRVVTLGTPHQGSGFSHRLAAHPLGRWLLGESLADCLLGGAPPWTGQVPLGSLAGSLSMGIGRILPGLPLPNDGTVAVSETVLSGMADHIVLPVSHTSMLFSAAVAGQVLHFLARGRFDKDAG